MYKYHGKKAAVKTSVECIPCFFHQALDAADIARASTQDKKKILDHVAGALRKYSLQETPPRMGSTVYRLTKKITKKIDPYLALKRKSNRVLLRIFDRLKNKVSHSPDRLLAAVELAIAGNIIDYGLKSSIDVNEELRKILREENKTLRNENARLFNYPAFKKDLKKAKTIMYIGDNAGESVFDRILIEEMKRLDPAKKITYAVRGKPVLNDVLAADAYQCGIDASARILSSGVEAPGTILSCCTPAFVNAYRKSDLIISKGQGNFEALSEYEGPIYFLFMAKCSVVTKHLGCRMRDVILLKNDNRLRK